MPQPFFYLLCPDGSALLGQPVALILGQAGSQLLEDLVFNMQYIQYAEVFASIPQPGYYYVQNPQSICHTQIKPATLVQNKIQVFRYYKDLYTRLGMYEEVRPQLYKFLIDIAESTYPSGPFKKVIDEAKAYWKEHKAELEQRS